MASVPDCLRLWERRLRAETERGTDCQPEKPPKKIRNAPQHEGSAERKLETTISTRAVRRSAADRRTGYEAASGPAEIQWLPGIAPDTHRLGKKGGLGSPQRLLVTFVRTKVTRVRGAR